MKKKFFKFLSILLSAALMFSVCGAAVSAEDATTDYGENAYFVKDGESGDGKSYTNPAGTVYDVIETINEDGLGEGDVANIYIMQRDDCTTYNYGSLVGGSDKLTPEHALTSWTSDGGAVPPHSAEIVVQAYNPDITTYLAYSGKVGQNAIMGLSGTTTFKNIMIVGVWSAYSGLNINGNNVTFEEGVSWGYLPHSYASSSTSTWTGTITKRSAMNISGGYFENTNTIDNKVNITYKNIYTVTGNKNETMHLDGAKPADTYKQDVTYTFDNSSIIARLRFGNGSGGSTIFEKNLNLYIKSANAVGVQKYSDRTVTINGGYQVIICGGASYLGANDTAHTASNPAWADLEGDISTFSNVTVKEGCWYITNKSDYTDLLTFTDSAGTYTVKSGYEAVATDAYGDKYYSEDGVLTVPAGEYTVDEYIPPVIKDYYVKYGGTGKGRSDTDPAGTVYDVIETLNEDELGENDIANIYIMQLENWKEINSDLDASTKPVHGLTAWAVDSAVPQSHTAQIIVQPYSSNTGKTYLATGDKYGVADYMEISGPTTFKNIAIITGTGYQGIRTNGNNVTFDADDVSFKAFGYLSAWPADITERNSTAIFFGAGETVTDEVNINFNHSYSTHSIASSSWNPEKLYLGKNKYKVNDVYNEDFNLTFNGLSTNQVRLVFGNSNSDINFKKNLNINLKSIDALVLENKTSTNVVIDGAFQLIKPAETVFTEAASFVAGTNEFADIQKFTGVTVSGGCWYITNATDSSDLLEFTETAGVYKVNSDANYVYAYSENSDTIYYGTDTLKITEAGSWTVKEVDALINIDYEPVTAGFISWADNGDGTMTAQYVVEGEALSQYSDYINYRGNLDNTYAKLTSGDKSLNVVYFGGSVTNGTGASDRDSTSWRALIGNWISVNFPEATVTNVNRAVGESGTYLGSYRVERDVISAEPDLLFIEYSINDYYSGASYETAALQYETIVRKVREALPECDIVTVLVTDSGLANKARAGTLHIQAQAHEAMAETYGISTIHVGRALADILPENWTYDDDWMLYMTDTVHPNDTGYKVYYQVIREFMYNSLFYAENEGTVSEYELIELQSDYLLDGNITVIEASEELLARSEELGGSGFEYISSSTYMHTYCGDVRASEEGAEFVLEMTGTELAAYISKTGTVSQFYVKVDDGEYELVDISNKNPTIIFEGLTSKKHTVYIKPVITDDITGRMAIPVFYSRDCAYQTTKYVDYGDCNADGVINIADLVNMKKKMADDGVYCPPVDIDKDGEMASGDLVKLRHHLLGKETIVWEDSDN